MLKLLRNIFSTVKVMVREDDQQIRWQYIEELHMLQDKEGLRLANKFKKKKLKKNGTATKHYLDILEETVTSPWAQSDGEETTNL